MKLVATVLGILFAWFVCVEVVLRWRVGELTSTENVLERQFRMLKNSCVVDPDPQLGWSPIKSIATEDNPWKTFVSTDEHGFRKNGPAMKYSPGPKKILAVGDSFTFGDQVSDFETWPAILERLSSQRVYNAGVCAYGIDQAILRAEQWLSHPSLRPDIVILSIMWMELARLEYRSYPAIQYSPKPYFEIKNKDAILHTEHVAGQSKTDSLNWTPVRRALGHSRIIDRVMRKLAPQYWMKPMDRRPPEYTSEKAEVILCPVLKRFQERVKKAKALPVVLLQYTINDRPEDKKLMDTARKCTERLGLVTIDLFPIQEKVKQENEKAFQSLFFGYGHMTALGNKLVANEVWKWLKSTY